MKFCTEIKYHFHINITNILTMKISTHYKNFKLALSFLFNVVTLFYLC